MTFAFIERHRDEFRVRRMCEVLDVSPSGYYAWRKRPVANRQGEDRRLAIEIRSIFRGSRESYGSPRVHRSLVEAGSRTSRKRVARLMRREGLRAKKGRRFRRTTKAIGGHAKAPNVLDRRFEVSAPNRVWVGDITYFWTPEGWLYLAVLLDLCSRKIVGWATSERLTTDLARLALERALEERCPAPGLIHHTDRGCQYTSDPYQRILRREGIIVSMSRSGNCWDNAVAESFFATLKLEIGSEFISRESAKLTLIDYIEGFYNRKRMHSAIGYATPAGREAALAAEEVA